MDSKDHASNLANICVNFNWDLREIKCASVANGFQSTMEIVQPCSGSVRRSGRIESSKSDAKKAASLELWRAIQIETMTQYSFPLERDPDLLRAKTIQYLIHDALRREIRNSETWPYEAFHLLKSAQCLAGIVAMDSGSYQKVICLTTEFAFLTELSELVKAVDWLGSESFSGNRHLEENHFCFDGTAINDSHAEVLARRALIKYLFTEIEGLLNGDKSWLLVREENAKFKIRSGISFHLYVSRIPCGDAANYRQVPPGWTELGKLDHEKTDCQKRSNAGRLFMKGEGDGNILANIEQSDVNKMCCSAKLALWKKVGLQGSLLSNFIPEPVKFASVVIGQAVSTVDCFRALCCRVESEDKVTAPCQAPIDIFALNDFQGDICLGKKFNKANDRGFILIPGIVKEYINTETGRQRFQPQERSTLCKFELYNDFVRILLRITGCPNGPTFYSAMKRKVAGAYQESKKEAETILRQDLSTDFWVKKSPESKLFFPSFQRGKRLSDGTD